jgi:hypothetical protein
MIPRYPRPFITCVAALMFCGIPSYSHGLSFDPNDPNAVRTADITGSKKDGQPVTNMRSNGTTPCSYGDKYRYALTTAGWLVAQSDINCPGGTTGSVGDTICTNSAKNYPQLPAFDKDLACTGPANTPSGGGSYKIDERGVTVNGALYVWANPQQALPILSIIKEKPDR